ncbi:MAG: helix-turn-helix domain-containing protein [Fimbriimonadales bacterium]
MARKRLPITLTPTKEAYLQRIEYTHPKPRPRLRAQVLRRAARGETPEQIAQYVSLHPDTIKRLRTRYVPVKRPDPQEYADACEDLARLKRGRSQTCMNDGKLLECEKVPVEIPRLRLGMTDFLALQ